MDFIPDAGIAQYQVQATARTFTSEKIRFDYNKNTSMIYPKNDLIMILFPKHPIQNKNS